VVLTPRRRRQVREATSRTTEARKPDLRGEYAISRKPLRGDAGLFWRPRCEYSCAYSPPHAHTRLRVRLAPGIPHALCFAGGETSMAKLARNPRRECEGMFSPHASSAREDVQASSFRGVRQHEPGISRFSDVPLHIVVRCFASPRNDEEF
jgi:hypothetical protein